MEGSTRPEKTVRVLFIDFKKAFDSVCHKTLNIKMQACGINGNLLNWLNDYLDNCIDYGVPHGISPGPKAVWNKSN